MVKGEREILHTDMACAAHYESSDLDYFEDILQELMQDLAERQVDLLDPANEAATRVKLAVSLFKSAQDGERDRARLKQRTLAAIAGVGAGRSAQAR